MARYHINSKGEPAICRATKKPCPLGNENQHYDSKEAAREAFEKENSGTLITTLKAKRPWEDHAIDDLAEMEEKSLEKHIKAGTTLTDEDYERRREYIRKVNKEYPSTHKQNTIKVKGKMVYTDERLAQHQEIINELKEKYSKVPKEGKVIMSGGMPGAGKTTLLKKELGEDLKNYATLNPDDVKEIMAEKGMTPKIKGLTPLETDELIKYEAQQLYNRAYDEISKDGTNLILDKTMLRKEPVLKDIEDLKNKGYTSYKTVFADITPDQAYERILSRHRKGIDEYIKSGGKTLGERVVPGAAISVARTENTNFKSKNAEVVTELSQMKAFSETPKVFDTSNGIKEISVEDLSKN